MQEEMTKKTKKTAVIYCRQSSGKDDLSTSIADQLTVCKGWCMANGVEVVGEYADFNTPGELYPDTPSAHAFCITDRQWQTWRKTRAFTKNYRKNLGELFTYIASHEVNYIVIHERTRLYRSPNNSFLDGFITNELAERKMAIVEVANNKIDHLNNVIDIAVQKLLATYEMQKIDEKAAQSKRVKKEKKAKGEYYSNAYGVQWVDKKIVFGDEHAKAIRMIFEGVLQGKSYSEILHRLNTEFFDVRTVKSGKQAKCFYESSIYNIVKNPVYSGYFLDGGTYREITNLGSTPIITLTQYLTAQKLVADRKHKNGKRRVSTGHFLPFSGLLTCGHCGKRLTMVDDKGIVYFCKNTILLKDKGCTSSRIRFNFAEDNDDFLLMFQPLFIIKLFQYKQELEALKNVDTVITSLTADVANLKLKIQNITDAYINNGVDVDMFRTTLANIKKDLVEKENKLIELKSKSGDTDREAIKKWNELINQVRGLGTLERLADDDYTRLLRDTITGIKVYEDHIDVSLFDGNTFSLPRTKANRRTKGLPFVSTCETYLQVEGYFKHFITYDCGGKVDKVVIDNTLYQIKLK